MTTTTEWQPIVLDTTEPALVTEALDERGAVLLRGIAGLSVADFAAYGANFGSVPPHFNDDTADQDVPEVAHLIRVRMDSGYKDPNSWYHQDLSAYAVPAHLTFLRCRIAPLRGGATEVVSTRDLLERATSEGIALDGLVSLHSPSKYYQLSEKLTEAERADFITLCGGVLHPVVRTGQSGKPGLYVNPLRSMAPRTANGVPTDILERLLDLYDEVPPYPVVWQPGDILVMDNYAVAHRSTLSVNCERELWRIVTTDPSIIRGQDGLFETA